MATKKVKGKEVEVTRVESYFTKTEAALLDKAAKISTDKEGLRVSRKAFIEKSALEAAKALVEKSANTNKKPIKKASKA